MDKIWIGDFRSKALRQLNNVQYQYIVDDFASYSWLATDASYKLENIAPADCDIVLMLGLVDCINSCTWSNLKIDKIASDYAGSINMLMEQYPKCNFYVCAVGPVNGDYSSSFAESNIILARDLNTEIESFNRSIKNMCKATFIDSYQYLTTTGFDTYDGVRYTQATAAALQNFILSNAINNISAFIPRLTAPAVETAVDSADPVDDFWIGADHGGESPFNIINTDNGSTLPSCTAYAWGRFYELLGDTPALSTSTNAASWYSYSSDGYKRGDLPALGAIACWQKSSSTDSGYVAVVEQINSDGSIVTSESGGIDTTIRNWELKTRINEDGNWGFGSDYTFQGFIYCPAVTPTASAVNLDKSIVTSKNESLTRAEMEANARYIWNYLGSKGWSLNAVAGMLGNMQHESTINPGRQQINGSGFGLVQWTPKEKLTKWLSDNGYADDDIDGQLERIIWEKDNKQQYAKNKYKYTFEEFSTSLDSPYILACAFAFDYERSAVTLWGATSKAKAATLTEAEKEANREALRQRRGGAAEEWYKFLAPLAPSDAVQQKFILNGFKLDSLSATKVKASFLLKNGVECQHSLSSDTENSIKGTLSAGAANNITQVISFECDSLIPNTSYTLSVGATSSVGGDTTVRSISFVTPQSRPDSAKEINLFCNDAIKSSNSIFKLSVKMPKNLGYWNKNNCGYEKMLIINNKCEKTKIIYNVTDTISESFKIQDEFDYLCKADDIVQIGIRIWTVDNKGEKIYDAPAAATSEPICLLNNSVQAYLNI